ncbi:hypothetical protein RF11_11145 [Thelohanellus kitauei]|uniref:Uncharacterized protein n=1 Tax=Thelohanellus kitauei TaxID=669202 RepID=A0A0C2JTS6_THEKT|nr:hypothetical protein RF11_11145 [Thelohanellus kitauei]
MTSYNNANEHYKELSRTSGAEEKRQATLNEFFEFFNQLDQQVLRLVKLHSNLIEEIQNVYTYLKSQIGQADSNKTRRYSIFEPDILEKQVYNDLTGLFKIPPGSVAHSGTFKNKSVGSKRARNKTSIVSWKSPATVATSKSAPKILKYAVDDDSNFHTTLDEIKVRDTCKKDNVLVEINFIKSIRGILKRVEGRLSSNTSFEKFHNDICNVVNEVSQVAEAIEKILSDIQAQYKSFGDMIDKDHRIQINRRLSSLKIKIQELTNLGNLV